MGFFDKLKQKLKKESKDEKTIIYEKGLTKSRKQFTSRLSELTKRHSKIDDDYFEE